MENQNKKWTSEEEQLLLREIRRNPQNLSKCFIAASRFISRTPSAIQAHWYSSTSKNPNNLCFFTASPKHTIRNRKNGEGEICNRSIWQRFLAIFNSI